MRSSKQIGTNARTYFLYDGDDLVCELDANGNVIATNTWGDSRLVARTTPARTICYAFDPQGNVSQAIDPNAPAGSQILNSCSADAYGYRYASTAYTDPYMGFGGEWRYYTDAEVGTQLLGHRFYDSGTGRFINRDPIGYEGGNNLYRYVSNNPIANSDPEGLDEECNLGHGDQGTGNYEGAKKDDHEAAERRRRKEQGRSKKKGKGDGHQESDNDRRQQELDKRNRQNKQDRIKRNNGGLRDDWCPVLMSEPCFPGYIPSPEVRIGVGGGVAVVVVVVLAPIDWLWPVVVAGGQWIMPTIQGGGQMIPAH